MDAARQFLTQNLTLPTGYSVEWTGLYQYAAAARARLRLVVPLTLVIIFALLVIAFRSVAETVLILMSVPFAMVGGVFLQWWLGYPMTTAVIVGYISLFAVAVQTIDGLHSAPGAVHAGEVGLADSGPGTSPWLIGALVGSLLVGSVAAVRLVQVRS